LNSQIMPVPTTLVGFLLAVSSLVANLGSDNKTWPVIDVYQ
jgi:hypothetical protein